MKKKTLLIIIFLVIINIFTISITMSYFTSLDRNDDSYIEIGQIKPKEITSFLYATTGPAFTYGVDIPKPSSGEYNYWSTLKGYPYNDWSYTKAKEIIDTLINKSVTSDFVTNHDTNYFKKNYISFDDNDATGFFNNQGFHLFAIISNNAHLIDNPKKIKLAEDTLNFEAFVRFKGEATERIWDTNYKGDIDFYNSKYYVTRAYTYNKSNKTYDEFKTGSWDFYNNADLIITDLGITGHIEIDKVNWDSRGWASFSHKLKSNMLILQNGRNDSRARVIKANYNVTFTPAWDASKKTRNILNLGE